MTVVRRTCGKGRSIVEGVWLSTLRELNLTLESSNLFPQRKYSFFFVWKADGHFGRERGRRGAGIARRPSLGWIIGCVAPCVRTRRKRSRDCLEMCKRENLVVFEDGRKRKQMTHFQIKYFKIDSGGVVHDLCHARYADTLTASLL